MDRFADSETQTDAVVVLSLAQAAVLGLVSENEFLGAAISAGSFLPSFANQPERKEPERDLPLEPEGPGQAEPPEEEGLEAEASLGKHARRRKRPPVRLVPKVKHEEGELQPEEEEEVAAAAAPTCERPASSQDKEEEEEEEEELGGLLPVGLEEPSREQTTVQSSTTKMLDLSTLHRKPRRLRHLRRPVGQELALGGYEEEGLASPPQASLESGPQGTEAFPRACGFPASAPPLGGVEGPAPDSPPAEQQGKREPGFVWQEPPLDFGAEVPAAGGEHSKKVQMDRLDINVQIDDSYLVEKRWQCRLCEKSYTSKYNLVTHILGHNGIKPHSCPHCSKLFKQPSHLQTHLLTHQGTRPHKCQVCHKAFTQTSHLKRHMLLHSDIKPYSCRFCGRGFAYPSELKAHEGKHESGRCHVCVECGLDFSTLTQLKRHLATHQGPTLYPCLECSKSFHYRSQLQNHMLKHQNVRPFVCSECGMEFSQIHHLKQHSLTHKGVKEFKCEVCGREFTLQANMKRHLLIHTSVRPYQCHICFKTFVQKQTLKTHMIVHSPVKPFKCKVCGKSFNRMYNLLGHMHLHAGSKPFKCPYCSSKFNLKGNLSRHMKVKHGVMDIALDSQDPMLELTGRDHHAELDGPQEMMEDYEEEEENVYDYGVGGDPTDASALTEQAMKEMAYYRML
ncbi:zinc finger protein 710 [Hemicordylus capensis]|uniref:zinc finger protein 710 n=1 Tax=Hemicordylus capensis TaxID=884348 RepID=UPI0023041AF4|nr:zinc finger protein 710 [Hemicordylus capensis]XP_053128399.1 zinc finger protein 710 [Hemicordylus capensis]XP_053128400.1 zinc finger protein 710 [Hemicordylus capensis]XP_053128401.1 zinc finger protein 710 [Hemicordylus capensis]XP_053128402.1 zinc finger protein 710 [Hemicordylus capensis]